MSLQLVDSATFATDIPNYYGLIASATKQELWSFHPSEAPDFR